MALVGVVSVMPDASRSHGDVGTKEGAQSPYRLLGRR